MAEEKINLKEHPILADRKEYVENEIIEFVKGSVIRKVFNTRAFDPSKDAKTEFIKLGTSSITNKEWYVKMPGNTYYDWKPIPKMYADSIEEGEIKLVLEKILPAIKGQDKFSEIVEDKNPAAANVFGKLLDQAITKVLNADLIITNIHDDHKFFWLDKQRFKFDYQRKERYLSGTYDGINIFVSRIVPKGKTIILNAKEVGDFIVKKDISANLGEIRDDERAKLKEILNLSDDDLNNRVRLLIEEVIQFVIKKPEAAILIETSKEEEESKV